MSVKKGTFMYTLEVTIMPKVYGIGAAVVILGALFKIMHWPGAGAMLTIGLLTEAGIFIISAFQPVHLDPDWAKVYPQLAEEDEDHEYISEGEKATPANLTKKLDSMMAGANITEDTISKLGQGLNSFSDNAAKLSKLGDASVATTEYANNVKKAASTMGEMNTAYGTTLEAMKSMSSAAGDSKAYQEAVVKVTKNLGALNAIYEMELSDANSHIKSMNKFYSNISGAMENLAAAGADTEKLRSEVNNLSKNLASLNNVYGNMLSAMKG